MRVAAFVLVVAVAVQAANVKLGFVSDFHLDGYYGTDRAFKRHNNGCASPNASSWGTFGCDSPAALINSSIAALLATNPSHIIVAGDWLRHDMALEKAAAQPMYAMVASSLSTAMHKIVPSPSLATALGNNDFVPDYFFNLSAPQHPLLSGFAETLHKDGLLSESEAATFKQAGFFVRALSGTRLTVVVINTMIWTYDLEPVNAVADDPLGQFAFLEEALANASRSNRKVIILSHMPPTINFFSVVHAADWPSPSVADLRYFTERYEHRYARIVADANNTIVAQVFGHTHRFSFSASGSRFGNVPTIVVGAVSPVYDNNPNFFTAEWDDERGELFSMQQHYLRIQHPDAPPRPWNWETGAIVPHVFGVDGPMTAETLNAVADRLSSDDGAFNSWRQIYNANASGGPCDSRCRRLAVCYTNFVSPADVYRCLAVTLSPPSTTSAPSRPSPGNTSSSVGLWLALGAIAVAAVCGALVAAVVVRRKRQQAFTAGYVTPDDLNGGSTHTV
uniref:Calcineurin-like phosphoesterase domain-containing protein n=2 Tax=Neobodo designis TaxID=312471 RepID=A0A7S1Q409_NEODS